MKYIFTLSLFFLSYFSLIHAGCQTTFHLLKSGIPTLSDAFDRGVPVGSGSFGQVRAVTYRGSKIAVKRIEHDLRYDSQFALEIQMNALISHVPGVSKILMCEDGPRYIYIGLELLYKDMAEHDIALYIRNLSRRNRVFLYARIAFILASLHNIGIVHEDMKPQNIMLTDSNFSDIRIIDFGMAGSIKELTKGGSPYYNCPSKISNLIQKNDPSHDIWAFGMTVLFFESFEKGNFFYGIPDHCFSMSMDEKCYELVFEKAKKTLDEEFAGTLFREAILKTLEYEDLKRPTAFQIYTFFERLLSNKEELAKYDLPQRKIERQDFTKNEGYLHKSYKHVESVGIIVLEEKPKYIKDRKQEEEKMAIIRIRPVSQIHFDDKPMKQNAQANFFSSMKELIEEKLPSQIQSNKELDQIMFPSMMDIEPDKAKNSVSLPQSQQSPIKATQNIFGSLLDTKASKNGFEREQNPFGVFPSSNQGPDYFASMYQGVEEKAEQFKFEKRESRVIPENESFREKKNVLYNLPLNKLQRVSEPYSVNGFVGNTPGNKNRQII